MKRSRHAQDRSEEGPLELAAMVCVALGVMGFVVWLFGSRAIVTGLTPTLRMLGSMWSWLPAQHGAATALDVHRTAAAFLLAPDQVGFVGFVQFANVAITPLMLCATAGCMCWFCAALCAPRQTVLRRFSRADDLLQGISRIFTGTAPILHIRQDLARHTDPLWARQRFPEEVLFSERVGSQPLVARASDDPSAQVADRDVIERWFKGIEPSVGWTGGSVPGHANLLRSRTLGHQVVDLTSPADRAVFRQPQGSFVDRFSDVGQVMFGLLCAHAFGGKEGIAHYRLARDQLNNSCRGAAHGLPRLAVAQWIVDRYRCNGLALRMFAVHHWEYTYLLELFIQAKRRGKVPDSEFRWLKPASRTLWYVLNTAGRFTPHTDSAGAFNQHAFERKCARRKRWPLRVNGRTGRLEPSIHVKDAAAGLMLEFERWVDGKDEDDDDWWKDVHQWVTSSPFMACAPPVVPVPVEGPASAQMRQTAFDRVQAAAPSPQQPGRTSFDERNQRLPLESLLGMFGADGAGAVLHDDGTAGARGASGHAR